MNDTTAAEPPRKPRVTAHDREIRRLRIFARRQAGASYDEIAREEDLTRERIRQIVVDSLERRLLDPGPDHARLQIARLDPALRLATEKVATGDLRGVDRLVKVLDRMDKYQGVAASAADNDGRDMKRLFAKILNALQNHNEATVDERRAAAAEAEERMVREDDVAKFF